MLIFCASLWVSCEEPEDNSSGNIDSNPDLNDDTFDENLSGENLQDLFFNIEKVFFKFSLPLASSNPIFNRAVFGIFLL